MGKRFITFLQNYVTRGNEFNVKLFKILGLGGIAVSILTCFYSLFEISYVSSITCFIAAILAAFLLYYVEKTGKYVFGYIVTEIGVFMTLFIILFFCGGGMEGSSPYFFAFSLIFTFLMFQNKLLIVMELLLTIVYLIACYIAYYYPKSLVTQLSEEALFYEKLVGIFLSAFAMGLIILAYINEYKKQKKIADDANAAKSTFLANMSHEIRTPINAIIGFNEIMIRETGEDKTREYAQLVNKAGTQLLTVVNQVLDFSRLDSGKETLMTEEYSLNDLVNEIFSVTTLGCQKKNIKATLEYDEAINKTLVGDREKLSRVLTNLLSNAVKYTKEGSVLLRVKAVGEKLEESTSDVYQQIRFEVEDTGIGIKQEDMDKLFHSYERIDLLTNQKIQDTGLGLAISKELVAMLGGDICVESEYGKGSKFYFEIFQKNGANTQEALQSTYEEEKHFLAPDVNILVVDDNHMNRTLIKEIADKTHYSYGYVKRVTSSILSKLELSKRSEIRGMLKR